MFGINIDIAHCVLAGLSSVEVFSNPVIRDLIYHFHISDHGAGHFADAVIGDCAFNACVGSNEDKWKRFQVWIWNAYELAKTRSQVPSSIPFSGMISVELEGAKYIEDVIDSCASLQVLLTAASSTR
jgi:hypothetical protein